jgi:subtilisin family serine protease
VRHGAVAIAVMTSVLGAGSVRARTDVPAPSAPPARLLPVDAAILDAIASSGWADVLVGVEAVGSTTAPLPQLAASAAKAQQHALSTLEPADFVLTRRYDYFPLLAGRISASGLSKLRTDPRVFAIDPDVWVRPLSPVPARQRLVESVASIEADKVHDLGIRGQGIGVAVVDTGIDSDHPDLVDALVDQQCFSSGSRSCAPGGLPRSASGEDEHGHGTGVSSIVLGRGIVAPLGVAPEAKLIGVRVFRDQGGAPTKDIVDGLNWVVGKQNIHNIRVVNMSLGGGAAIGTNCDDSYSSVKSVFQTLVNRNVMVVVATGNGGNPDRVAFPACISNATGVGSTWDTTLRLGQPDCHGKLEVGPFDITCYTDRGRAMDIVAPGSVIVTSKLGGGVSGSGPTAGGHGTSYAAPHVAGVAALVLSADPSIHARDLERVLKNTGDSFPHPDSGLEVRRVNAYRAVLSVLPATPTAATPTPTAPTATPTSSSRTPTPTSSVATTATATTDLATSTPASPTADAEFHSLWLPDLLNRPNK